MADRDYSGLNQYRQERRKFSFRVYFLAIIFGAITIGQWIAILFVEQLKKLLLDYYYITIISLLVALLFITLFVFCEGLRFTSGINFILSLLIVELVAIGLGRMVTIVSLKTFGICLGSAFGVTLLFLLIGAFFPRDLTLDVVVVFVFAIVFFVGSVFFAAVTLIANLPFSMYIFCGFVAATVLLFIMYHAQTISGGRYAEMRLNDHFLASLIIYHDFIILSMMSFIIASSITGEFVYLSGMCQACSGGRSADLPDAADVLATTAAQIREATTTSKPTKVSPKKPHFYNIYLPHSYEDYQRKYNLAQNSYFY